MGVVTVFVFVGLLIANGLADDKVIVGFYGESLCPDCIAFCTGPLHKAVQEVCYVFASFTHLSYMIHALVFV